MPCKPHRIEITEDLDALDHVRFLFVVADHEEWLHQSRADAHAWVLKNFECPVTLYRRADPNFKEQLR
jgi:hypothetical protein